jgi:hypothetical protein
MIRRSSLLVVPMFFLAIPLTVHAQAANPGLEKTDKGFKHAASGTEFIIPEKWNVLQPRPLPNGVSVGIDWPSLRIAVTLYWVPLENKTINDFVRLKPEGPNNSYGQEHDTLKVFYGPDKIGKPELIKVGDRAVYKIPVASGPDKDGSTVGVLYVWEAGPNPKERWRIKMRASYPKQDEAEHAKRIAALLGNFK